MDMVEDLVCFSDELVGLEDFFEDAGEFGSCAWIGVGKA